MINPSVADPQISSFEKGMLRLIRHQLENLQSIIELERQGSPASDLRFRLFTQPAAPSAQMPATAVEGQKPVKADSATVYRHLEPRLQMISHLLWHLGRCGCFEVDGNPVSVESFRLKDLVYWARYPSPRLIDNFGELSTLCSCDCDFCFLKGSGKLSPKRPLLSLKEARTRARYYSPLSRLGLPTPSAPPGEPLLNPRAIDLIRIARVPHPDHVIDITTNGDFLSEAVIQDLAALKPVHISLSLNSANVERRRRIMRSPRPEIGIQAAPLLQAYGIQFTGSIVPSPNEPLEDVAETMRYLDRFDPLQIRLLLPGFTRYALTSVKFDTQWFWNALVELGNDLRTDLRSPLLIQPGYFWNRSILAYIDGIFPNSPAEHAGLRFGDRITKVNDQVVITRAEAGHLLDEPPAPGKPWTARVEVERAGKRFSVDLSNHLSVDEDFYPYKPKGYEAAYDVLARWEFGIQLMDGFDLGPLKTIKELVERHPEARHVLIFTTPLVKDLYSQALQIVGDSPECRLPDVEVRVTVAQQKFWGGNIIVGDLHVVSDFIDHLRLLREMGYQPDLAIIPSTFTNTWGLDLLGHSYYEIERQTGVTVELVPVKRVMV